MPHPLPDFDALAALPPNTAFKSLSRHYHSRAEDGSYIYGWMLTVSWHSTSNEYDFVPPDGIYLMGMGRTVAEALEAAMAKLDTALEVQRQEHLTWLDGRKRAAAERVRAAQDKQAKLDEIAAAMENLFND